MARGRDRTLRSASGTDRRKCPARIARDPRGGRARAGRCLCQRGGSAHRSIEQPDPRDGPPCSDRRRVVATRAATACRESPALRRGWCCRCRRRLLALASLRDHGAAAVSRVIATPRRSDPRSCRRPLRPVVVGRNRPDCRDRPGRGRRAHESRRFVEELRTHVVRFGPGTGACCACHRPDCIRRRAADRGGFARQEHVAAAQRVARLQSRKPVDDAGQPVGRQIQRAGARSSVPQSAARAPRRAPWIIRCRNHRSAAADGTRQHRFGDLRRGSRSGRRTVTRRRDSLDQRQLS